MIAGINTKWIKTALAASVFLLAACNKDAVGESADDKQAQSVQEKTSVDAETVKALVVEKLGSSRPDLQITEVKPSRVDNIFEVTIRGGGTIYVSSDAEYFFLGDLYQILPNKLVNISELAKNDERMAIMKEMPKEDYITFSPKGEVKASVAVFTDVDCGYCRKLHQEVPKMNELGIEVRYLAYPRAGIGSKSYNKITSAWCAADRNKALTDLKNGRAIEENVCEDNPVAKQFSLGGRVGVRGTPAIVLESGEMIPGYMPADELAKQLGI